jgi:HTH-type transcriptional regulator/antitoxin HipB
MKLKGPYELKKNMKTKTKRSKNLKSFEEFLEERYGKKGAAKRNAYEAEYEAFRLGVLIQEARKKQHISQAQLAEKCGTNKSYISRIENDASDIRLSTLMRIIERGLGGHLRLTIKF